MLRTYICLLLLAQLLCLTAARCECGYLTQDPNNTDTSWVFSDALESDFTRIHKISEDSDWARQKFNVTAEAGRGKYGKSFSPDNVVDGSDDGSGEDATGASGTGLQLVVRSGVTDDDLSVAEIDSSRLDLQWGSYRAGMKMTGVNGTCAAFFWYFNNSQEIDMEFLSREFDKANKIFPVNLVIQTKESMEAGYDASATGTFRQVNLTFDPTEDFHEYRFDYLPGRVLFYADSQLLAEMDGDAVPTSGGHLILQHWSNGNPLWSGGPPAEDAVLTVNYVKAYFNSSESQRQADSTTRCSAAARSSEQNLVCQIPNVYASNASTGGTFLDPNTQDGHSETDSSTGASANVASCGLLAVVMLLTTLMAAVGGLQI